MGEYDRTGNGQSSKTDWDLRSILCDIAKNWWVILLIACSAAMITYTVMATVHKDRYTVKTTFAVMGRGVDANAASSLSATYEMAQKFEAILENTILKKKVMEELSLSSFPAKMNASIVPESNLMELSVTADSPEMAFRILKSVLNNYTSISDYIIPNVVLETLQQPQVSGVPSNQIPTKKYAATAFLAAALAMAALIGLFSFLRDTVKNEAEFTRKIDADLLGVVYHEKKKKNSSMLITNPARSFLYEGYEYPSGTNVTRDTVVIEKQLSEWKKTDRTQLVNGIMLIGLKDYGKYATHLYTYTWADDEVRKKREADIMADKKKSSRTKVIWKIKTILRNPRFISFFDGVRGTKIDKVYTFIAYDLLDYGLLYFVQRLLRKIRK